MAASDRSICENNTTTMGESLQPIENNTTLQTVLGLLINEFRLLHESVDTVHSDYADLKSIIFKQKDELKQELAIHIDSNTQQLRSMTQENQALRKECDMLKTRLDKLEQAQLSNNVMITGIQEGPFEPYTMTKLRVYEMIAASIQSGNSSEDLETAKKVEITSCGRVGKYRHNYPQPITLTFARQDDKENFLSNKCNLPAGVFANEDPKASKIIATIQR